MISVQHPSTEYSEIENELIEKFKLFKEDINSRRVLYTADICISMIHFLIRNNVIYVFVHLRSSDAVFKLFSDLFLIHKLTRRLQDEININKAIIKVNADSFHEIAIRNLSNL